MKNVIRTVSCIKKQINWVENKFIVIFGKKSFYIRLFILFFLYFIDMRLSLFAENSEVLLLGEGNFSFAVTLLHHDLNIKLTATCYENSVIFDSAKRNVEYLNTRGQYVINFNQ